MVHHLMNNFRKVIFWFVKTTASDVNAAWRCEFDVSLNSNHEMPQNQGEAWTLLATNAEKQRTEIRLSELTASEKAEFDKAKEAEVQN